MTIESTSSAGPTVDPMTLADLKVTRTIIGGETVYEA